MHKYSLLTNHFYFLVVVSIHSFEVYFISRIHGIHVYFMFFADFAHFLNQKLTLSPHISNKHLCLEFAKVVCQII